MYLPTEPHIDISQDGGLLCAVFPPPRHWGAWVYLAWLASLLVLSVHGILEDTAHAAAAGDVAQVVFNLVILGPWLALLLLTAYRLLFFAAGRELILLDGEHLILRREVPLLTRERKYISSEIQELRAD